jgi:hypothetical protein
MNVREVIPSVDCRTLLAGAEFADSYRIAIDGTQVKREAGRRKNVCAETAMGRNPARSAQYVGKAVRAQDIG